MIIEFVTQPQLDFMALFAKALKVEVVNNELQIPPAMGEGFARRVALNDDFRLLIHRYRLKEDLVLKRIGSKDPASFISIIFYSNEEPLTLVTGDQQGQQFTRYNDMAIQIASNNLDSVITFPANTEIYFNVVGISAARLDAVLTLSRPDPLIEAITNPKGSFLFYESMGAEAQIALKQLSEDQVDNPLASFYYRLKVEGLLYYVFDKLCNRQAAHHSPVNKADVEKLFVIRTAVLGDLSRPPSLPDLAKLGGMSETKMKELFRQVFGDSIYNYYQTARMEEAAYLLKHKNYSVSEVGYQLGFSNLSHFSRLFERHHQQKPKKYASGG